MSIIEKARQELIKYVKDQKIEDPRVEKKLGHIMRVEEISKKIAMELKLTKEQIQLAQLIGLLHDIGRFKQYQVFATNINDTTIKLNHGEEGVKILKDNHYIRNFIQEDRYDDIIYTAIYEHNRYELSKELTKEKELFCKIIKDADKIDQIYEASAIYWQKPEDIQEIEKGKLSEKMLRNFYQYQVADIRNSISRTDQILRFTSYIFDINFSYSFRVLKENESISKMLDRFHYQLPETKEEMSKIKKIANEYIKQKCS